MSYFRGLCWIPAALWICARVSTERYDGWGAWAAAPIFLIPVAVSAMFVGVGVLLGSRPGSGRFRGGDRLAIGVAALPLLWLALRLLRP